MSISSSHKDLFRNPAPKDKLILFQSLLDTKVLTADLTLALLKIVHKELSTQQNRDHSGYKRYAEAIESLHYHLPEMLQQVVDAWNPNKMAPPAEWFSHG